MPFSSSFKNFKDCFLKVLVREDFTELILSQRGWLRFPLYWKSHPVPTTQKKLNHFESWEQSQNAVLEAFPVVSTAAVLECRDSSSLFQYLGNFNDFFCFFGELLFYACSSILPYGLDFAETMKLSSRDLRASMRTSSVQPTTSDTQSAEQRKKRKATAPP